MKVQINLNNECSDAEGGKNKVRKMMKPNGDQIKSMAVKLANK